MTKEFSSIQEVDSCNKEEILVLVLKIIIWNLAVNLLKERQWNKLSAKSWGESSSLDKSKIQGLKIYNISIRCKKRTCKTNIEILKLLIISLKRKILSLRLKSNRFSKNLIKETKNLKNLQLNFSRPFKLQM